MIPVIQTVIGSGDDGQPMGNCMRACIASIFEVGIDDVPLIELLPEDDWWATLYTWILEKDCDYLGWGKPESITDPKFNKGVDGYVMVSGTSPRGFQRGHAVVYKDGKLAHDPHPSGDGIGEVEGFYMIERVVRISPWEKKKT